MKARDIKKIKPNGKKQTLQNLKQHHEKVDACFDLMDSAFGNIEGEIGNTLGRTWDALVESTARELDINEETLFWFIYDTDWGRKPSKVEIKEKNRTKTITVKDINSFLKTV